MYNAADFNKAIADYVEYNKELKKSTSFGSSLLSLFKVGKSIDYDPGHAKFYDEMSAAIKSVADSGPDPVVADGIMDVILRARDVYADSGLSEYAFIAIECTGIELIPFMSREHAAEAYKKYTADYPRYRLLPKQKLVLSALKEAAGA